MDKKIAGLLGAAAALTALGSAQASPEQGTGAAPVASYRELLEPVPNPLAALKADDSRRSESAGSENVQLAQWHDHHHHHRRHHHRRRHHHHHHHRD